MTKQEKIQEAYGEFWEQVKYFLDRDGWCNTRKNIDFEKIKENIPIEFGSPRTYPFRPTCLKGIETNNGWIKIDSEADLPKEEGDYWVIYYDTPERVHIMQYYIFNITTEVHRGWWINKISHYQPIIKPELPIY